MGEIVRHSLKLSVLGGIHRGAVIELTGPVSRIGSGSMCDVLLSDDGVEGEHFVVRTDGKATSIEAVNGPIVLGSGTKIDAGACTNVEIPARFEVESVQLLLEWAQEFKGEGGSFRRFRGVWICGAAAFLAASAVALHVNGAVGDPARLSNQDADPVMPVPTKVASSAEVVADLNGRLREMGLGTLVVTANGSQVNVTGALPPTQMSEWLDIQKWFDGRFGASYILSSHVDSRLERPEPRFNFQAVWFGDRPYAIGSDGARLYVGAALEGGWVIEEIRDGRLTVRRDNENFVLTF